MKITCKDYEEYYAICGKRHNNIFGGLLLDYHKGEMVEVSFNYEKIYELEDAKHNVLGFYHTHPCGCSDYSDTDVRTMSAWVTCLGKSLLCLVESDTLRGWFFAKNGDIKEISCYKIGRMVLGF